MRNHINKLFIFTLLLLLSSCLKDEISELQKQLDDLEKRTEQLEATQDAMIALLQAHEGASTIEDVIIHNDGTTLLMSDGSKIFIPNTEATTPYIGANGNWWINGEDTGVSATGNDGEQGSSPYIGENGNWWIDGEDTGVPSTGNDGENGTNGDSPYIGQNGNWWIGGEDTGVPASGHSGQDGLTPYVGENGNWWIGDSDTGIPVTGSDGENGEDGLTPYVGENGNWWIGDSDTGIPVAGNDGENGEDGLTPYVGENGNWWIGDTDTGQKAAAPVIISIQYESGYMIYHFSDGTSIEVQIEMPKSDYDNMPDSWYKLHPEGYKYPSYFGMFDDESLGYINVNDNWCLVRIDKYGNFISDPTVVRYGANHCTIEYSETHLVFKEPEEMTLSLYSKKDVLLMTSIDEIDVDEMYSYKLNGKYLSVLFKHYKSYQNYTYSLKIYEINNDSFQLISNNELSSTENHGLLTNSKEGHTLLYYGHSNSPYLIWLDKYGNEINSILDKYDSQKQYRFIKNKLQVIEAKTTSLVIEEYSNTGVYNDTKVINYPNIPDLSFDHLYSYINGDIISIYDGGGNGSLLTYESDVDGNFNYLYGIRYTIIEGADKSVRAAFRINDLLLQNTGQSGMYCIPIKK
ncbi:collagen-like domain-containing protein [Flammeovirga agarivorans]|uniref:DUF4988 domain-containing protein n=1 Tax=Flammeovirga agarivorans TaxID=2726742 RepID=A0A7X8SPF8_9BACT|nr:hypothetical protein [Flammeovirga agarivorans]NLR93912.1 hypothetical protein [Flammeovirga agarivorans]